MIGDLGEVVQQELVARFDELKGLEIGTKEYETAVSGLSKLIDSATKIDNQEDDQAVKTEELNIKDKQLKLQEEQLKVDKKHKVAMIAVAAGTTILTIAMNIWGTKTSLEYEEKGVIPTTLPGRKFSDRLFKN